MTGMAATLRYRAAHPERATEITQRRIQRHHAYTDELKSGGCIDCGTTEVRLHFHHLDPATKLFPIAYGWKHSKAALEAEIAKCVVVCEPCHKARHRALVTL